VIVTTEAKEETKLTRKRTIDSQTRKRNLSQTMNTTQNDFIEKKSQKADSQHSSHSKLVTSQKNEIDRKSQKSDISDTINPRHSAHKLMELHVKPVNFHLLQTNNNPDHKTNFHIFTSNNIPDHKQAPSNSPRDHKPNFHIFPSNNIPDHKPASSNSPRDHKSGSPRDHKSNYHLFHLTEHKSSFNIFPTINNSDPKLQPSSPRDHKSVQDHTVEFQPNTDKTGSPVSLRNASDGNSPISPRTDSKEKNEMKISLSSPSDREKKKISPVKSKSDKSERSTLKWRLVYGKKKS